MEMLVQVVRKLHEGFMWLKPHLVEEGFSAMNPAADGMVVAEKGRLFSEFAIEAKINHIFALAGIFPGDPYVWDIRGPLYSAITKAEKLHRED